MTYEDTYTLDQLYYSLKIYTYLIKNLVYVCYKLEDKQIQHIQILWTKDLPWVTVLYSEEN